jgi:SAM-dependent methyltransferase
MPKIDSFFYKKLNYDNLDNFYARDSIKKAIIKNANFFKGKLLDAGCGKMPYRNFILGQSDVKEYIGLDIESALEYSDVIKPDYTWNGVTMPFSDDTFDTIISTEVLEHCFDYNTYIKECLRTLKPGGIIFFTVPFLWPLHEGPYDYYRYTPHALKKMFKDLGQDDLELFSLGGWNASLATMIGLWSKRYLSKKKSKLLNPVIIPFMKYLIKKDKVKTNFENNTMSTGFCGVLKKNNG